jgi:hypothetical protein
VLGRRLRHRCCAWLASCGVQRRRWSLTRDYLDLVEPAYMSFAKNGRGEFAFGAVDATMELGYGQRIVFFNWTGFDEGDEIYGSGSAELEDDGTIEIELSFHNGDDAILKARRE